jgi:hypothetical protein
MKNRIFAVANRVNMTSIFKIHYHAQWGETLAVVLNDKKSIDREKIERIITEKRPKH